MVWDASCLPTSMPPTPLKSENALEFAAGFFANSKVGIASVVDGDAHPQGNPMTHSAKSALMYFLRPTPLAATACLYCSEKKTEFGKPRQPLLPKMELAWWVAAYLRIVPNRLMVIGLSTSPLSGSGRFLPAWTGSGSRVNFNDRGWPNLGGSCC